MATLTGMTEPKHSQETRIPMDHIEHVISWKGLSDEKWHTQVVFKEGFGNTICSCQGKIGELDARY